MVLVAPDGTRKENSSLTGAHGCNNEAELHALCAALELAAAAGVCRLRLHSDSDVALRYARVPAATRIERLSLLALRAGELLRPFVDVELVWIPRHRNAEADRLSRLALGLPAVVALKAGRRRR